MNPHYPLHDPILPLLDIKGYILHISSACNVDGSLWTMDEVELLKIEDKSKFNRTLMYVELRKFTTTVGKSG